MAGADDLCVMFKSYCAVGAADHFTGSACKKMVEQCWAPKLAKVNKLTLVNTVDTAFTRSKDQKQWMTVNSKTIDSLCSNAAEDISKKCGKDAKVTAEELKAWIVKKKDVSKAMDKSGVTDRLTNASGYTGSHKERFDKDGKGKGKDGRVDTVDSSGYVGAYKNKDTYDKQKK